MGSPPGAETAQFTNRVDHVVQVFFVVEAQPIRLRPDSGHQAIQKILGDLGAREGARGHDDHAFGPLLHKYLGAPAQA
jgi:hypothetical protein